MLECRYGHLYDPWGHMYQGLQVLFGENREARAVDGDEPGRLAESIKTLGVKHCVLTSVDRDDLEDGGASFWAETILTVKKINPEVTLETLIPDFRGNQEHIQLVIKARPEVISHNLETVRSLTPRIRSLNRYETSLEVVRYISSKGVISKSGIMLGLGRIVKKCWKPWMTFAEPGAGSLP